MTITKTVERFGVRSKKLLVITAELRENDPRGLSNGFAITANLYEPHGTWSGRAQFRNGREPDAGGCLHNEILKMAPSLKPLVDVHLADPNGVPMHALASSWYHYSGNARRREDGLGYRFSSPDNLSDIERAARSLNIPVEDVPEGLDYDQFVEFVESLLPRWAEQARVARELLESL